MPSPFAPNWTLDPGVTFLNHGSFGACPQVVQAAQAEWRRLMEAEPVAFLSEQYEARLDAAREGLAGFVGARGDDMVFVPNATTGVNAVLRSLDLLPGDELLTTDHAYNACRNALDYVAERSGAAVVVARVPFLGAGEDEVVDSVMAAVTPRTRLAMVDHVTSPTAMIWPIHRLVDALHGAGVDVLVDGAHGPGMVPLALSELGADYYTGNCHKWMCAPKGAGFLWVRPDRQRGLMPTTVSHGANSERRDRSRFHLVFDWTGTADPTPYLAVPTAIEVMGAMVPGGWAELMEANRTLARHGREVVAAALSVEAPIPDGMLGAMASLPLPVVPADGDAAALARRLHGALRDRWAVQVPVFAWSGAAHPILRLSAQLYNGEDDYARLARALAALITESPARYDRGVAASSTDGQPAPERRSGADRRTGGERRSGERRTGKDRRRRDEPIEHDRRTGSDRRSGADRRSGTNRRSGKNRRG